MANMFHDTKAWKYNGTEPKVIHPSASSSLNGIRQRNCQWDFDFNNLGCNHANHNAVKCFP